MKAKAAVTRSEHTVGLVERLNHVRPEFMERVAKPLLHFESDPGPAAIFVQECDMTVEDESGLGCNVVVSDVTPNEFRSVNDLRSVVTTVMQIYRRHIENEVAIGQKVQLFVVLFLSHALPNGEQTLEWGPEWIDGAKTSG